MELRLCKDGARVDSFRALFSKQPNQSRINIRAFPVSIMDHNETSNGGQVTTRLVNDRIRRWSCGDDFEHANTELLSELSQISTSSHCISVRIVEVLGNV